MLQSSALLVLYVKQDVNLTWLSWLRFKNWKINMKICKSVEKKLFCNQDGMG